MLTKKMVPCIWLYQNTAVADAQDMTEISPDPVSLARSYEAGQCDELLVCDLSTDDRSHDEAIDMIREICSTVSIPVLGAGHIRRMEDVKKLLYAGCRQALLDYDREDNVELTREVSLKFGPDRLLARITGSRILKETAALLSENVSGVLMTDISTLKTDVSVSPVPVLAVPPDISLDKLIELMKLENLYGIAGRLVNDNVRELEAIRKLSAEAGASGSGAEPAFSWQELKKNSDGMVPVIVQDWQTDTVLMQAYMDEEAYLATLRTGKMTYFSRSRKQLWVKGETSGHFQYVKSLRADCDLDTILARVEQIGPACHTGSYSCFFNDIIPSQDAQNEKASRDENSSEKGQKQLPHDPARVFEEVYGVILDRKEHPKEGSYTNYLFDKGIDKILKKLGEEATEIVIAAKNPNPNEIKYEICDFLYHMMVLMAEKGITWEEIMEELAKR